VHTLDRTQPQVRWAASLILGGGPDRRLRRHRQVVARGLGEHLQLAGDLTATLHLQTAVAGGAEHGFRDSHGCDDVRRAVMNEIETCRMLGKARASWG